VPSEERRGDHTGAVPTGKGASVSWALFQSLVATQVASGPGESSALVHTNHSALNAANGVDLSDRIQFIELHRASQFTGASTGVHTQKGLLKQEDTSFNTNNPTLGSESVPEEKAVRDSLGERFQDVLAQHT